MTAPFSFSLITPNAVAGQVMTAGRSGTSYTADSYGIVHSVTPQDAVDLVAGGALSMGQTQARNNLAATILPGVTDDISKDYAPGSRWLVPAASKEYTCFANTLGAAVWAALN